MAWDYRLAVPFFSCPSHHLTLGHPKYNTLDAPKSSTYKNFINKQWIGVSLTVISSACWDTQTRKISSSQFLNVTCGTVISFTACNDFITTKKKTGREVFAPLTAFYWYGLKVGEIEGEVYLRLDKFKSTTYLSMFDLFTAWQEMAAKLERGEISKEEYDA